MTLELTRLRFTALLIAALLSSFVVLPGGARAQETPPPPTAPRSPIVPKPVERTLGNGLRVIVVENHETPLVVAQLTVKNGGEVDPASLSGVADMTGSLLTKGTTTRTAPLIDRTSFRSAPV